MYSCWWHRNLIIVISAGLLLCSLVLPCTEAKGGRGGGRGRSGSSRSSYSSSRSSYGSSSYSGSSRTSYGSTSYGSSLSSGSRKTSAFGRSWASGASGGASSSKNWHAGPSAVKSESNRPSLRYDRPLYSRPVAPVYNNHITVINSPSRGYYGSNTDGLVTGYFLGRMMSSSHHPGGYGYGYHSYPYYYDSYVPYRYRYSSSSATGDTGATSTSPPANFMATNIASQQVDVCTLARWNMELPYTELPNMMLTFLSDDNISGSNLTGKSQFLLEMLDTAINNYGWFEESANLFEVDKSKDLKECNFALPRQRPEWTTTTTTTQDPEPLDWFERQHLNTMMKYKGWLFYKDTSHCQTMTERWKKYYCECTNTCGVTPKPPAEEPFVTGAKRLKQLYSSDVSDQELLKDLVQSAKNCFGAQENPKNLSINFLPCLDYSVSVDQLMSMDIGTWSIGSHESVFGNDEVCRKNLAPNIKSCIVENATSACGIADIVNLNIFARNFYLCQQPVDSVVLTQLEVLYPPVPKSYSYANTGYTSNVSKYMLILGMLFGLHKT